MTKKIIKKYSWHDFIKAMKESEKSLAELFDFESGLLIWRENDTADNLRKAEKET